MELEPGDVAFLRRLDEGELAAESIRRIREQHASDPSKTVERLEEARDEALGARFRGPVADSPEEIRRKLAALERGSI